MVQIFKAFVLIAGVILTIFSHYFFYKTPSEQLMDDAVEIIVEKNIDMEIDDIQENIDDIMDIFMRDKNEK